MLEASSGKGEVDAGKRVWDSLSAGSFAATPNDTVAVHLQNRLDTPSRTGTLVFFKRLSEGSEVNTQTFAQQYLLGFGSLEELRQSASADLQSRLLRSR